MLELRTENQEGASDEPTGEFCQLDGERWYAIRDVDKMPPFFVSVVSANDHWLFVSSTGGLTAGRESPESALFPYAPVDKIHDSAPHTGSKTLIRIHLGNADHLWEPFNREHDGRFAISRNLYKSVAGDKLRFEELNHDLQLVFRYTWATSDEFGFSRQCELHNQGGWPIQVELLDGLQNILPAGTPTAAQANASNLVDAYKWTELDQPSGLAVYALYSAISDRAEPYESLRATTVFCLGLDEPRILLSADQLAAFRSGQSPHAKPHLRGVRGAYLACTSMQLDPGAAREWRIVANVERSQQQVVALQRQLGDPAALDRELEGSIARNSLELARIMASTDALQCTAEEIVAAHHYANVLFNNLRGGIVDDQNFVSARDFADSVRHFSRQAYGTHREFLLQLDEKVAFAALLTAVRKQGDPDLERLCLEYLPIRFGRRHGDPSRPWNQFAIRLRDEHGRHLFSYEGNWRDIFQNWEALTFSYPEFIENIIARFVNASTIDGYNPYRINKEGIDWEVEDEDDPWSYIGYWGDHQIIYLLKLLEASNRFHPSRLNDMLRREVFSYANVPYRIKPFAATLEDPKDTVEFDRDLAEAIAQRVEAMGADGKLVLDGQGAVYRVNLLEKLLVPLLSKLGNLVVDGGIWLNTQRPEWNDANNALVGNGLSMVTLYYLRRYMTFLQRLVSNDQAAFEISSAVVRWLDDTATALQRGRGRLGPIPAGIRFDLLADLGNAASRYRASVYDGVDSKSVLPVDAVHRLLDDALALIDHSIRSNRRDDGLYNAYNLLRISNKEATVDSLYPMLEGQVAALSAGYIEPEDACDLLQALFDSDIYRADQHSFMLYPDRDLPGYLEKNCVPDAEIDAIPLLGAMLAGADERIIGRDANGTCRFHADFANVDDLKRRIDDLVGEYGEEMAESREPLRALYERVFDHRAFTGRSGGMFGFEGLGCVYWHMVSKLLLAIQENYFAAVENGVDRSVCDRLGTYYYRVREGLGFNKKPAAYGAFPADPYSHTPKHAGAQQPGMTGQVKEEVLSRFGELGVRVTDGVVRFRPHLLRAREFANERREFRFFSVTGNWETLTVPAEGLAYTWCQVPIVYELSDPGEPAVRILGHGGNVRKIDALELPAEECAGLFGRSGRIAQIRVTLRRDMLFAENGDAEPTA